MRHLWKETQEIDNSARWLRREVEGGLFTLYHFTSSIFNHANVPSGQINLTQLKLSKKRYNIINRFFWKVTTVWRDCVEQEERDQRQEEGATAPSNHEAVKPQIRQSEHGERAQISGVIWE